MENYKIIDGEFLVTEVNGEIIFIDSMELFEKYQQSTEQLNINCFMQESNERKEEIYKVYKADCILNSDLNDFKELRSYIICKYMS